MYTVSLSHLVIVTATSICPSRLAIHVHLPVKKLCLCDYPLNATNRHRCIFIHFINAASRSKKIKVMGISTQTSDKQKICLK